MIGSYGEEIVFCLDLGNFKFIIHCVESNCEDTIEEERRKNYNP